jgi:hypothetical protein
MDNDQRRELATIHRYGHHYREGLLLIARGMDVSGLCASSCARVEAVGIPQKGSFVGVDGIDRASDRALAAPSPREGHAIECLPSAIRDRIAPPAGRARSG